MSSPSQALKALTETPAIAEALLALAPQLSDVTRHLPLIGVVADYIDGGDGIVPPDLPSALKSDIELRRLRVLAAKASAPPVDADEEVTNRVVPNSGV